MIAWLVANKDLAEAVAYWAQAFALVTGALAVIKYLVDRSDRRRAQARALYASFMDDALQHPDMYGGVWRAKASADIALASKYSYFIGKFLWAAEEVLRCHPSNQQWKETVRVTLREHVDYLRSDEFRRERGGYPKHVIDLIDEVAGDRSVQAKRARLPKKVLTDA